MEVSQIENSILTYIRMLPKESANEILDFAKFLAFQKNIQQGNNISMELSLLSQVETEHLEKEFENYEQLYPCE